MMKNNDEFFHIFLRTKQEILGIERSLRFVSKAQRL